MSHDDEHDHEQDLDSTAFWEDRYSGVEQAWSGRVNQVLADVAAGLSPGRALDLGCGEGADAIWLAQRGWQVTGVDISPTAIARAQRAAEGAAIPSGRIRWHAHDLATWAAGEAASGGGDFASADKG